MVSLKKHLVYSFLGGVATAIGATIGFGIVIWIITQVFSSLGGLPVVGEIFADIVEATNRALEGRR